MFDSIKENMRKANEERAKTREEQERKDKARAREAEMNARLKDERERKIATIRVITGDVKYRYAILDTLRVFSHYTAEPGQPYDPTASSMQATRLMQELAFAAGADAVIHAQYQIVRYTTQRRNYADVPVYETHLFGTAIKVMGPPTDWASDRDEKNPE
ncbi:MAG: hypothetical protein EB059_01865 [Alphaproteobacteria bacterium]|nr:hypothetical protein [Alphaproteobacteria bacterium]